MRNAATATAAATAGFAFATTTSLLPQAHPTAGRDGSTGGSLPLTRTCIADAAARGAPAVVNLQCKPSSQFSKTISTGSGFIVDESGLLLTNAHVVKGCKEVLVTFWDGRTRVRGAVHSMDERSDIALVQIIDKPPRSIRIDDKFPVIQRGVSNDLRAGMAHCCHFLQGKPLRSAHTMQGSSLWLSVRHSDWAPLSLLVLSPHPREPQARSES